MNKEISERLFNPDQSQESIRTLLENKVRFILNVIDKPNDIQVMPKNHNKSEFQKAKEKFKNLSEKINNDIKSSDSNKSEKNDEPEDELIKNQRESTIEVENVVQNTINLSEELVNSFPTGVELDDKYFEDVATLAADYYSRKNWHEQLDEHHIAEHQKRWSDERDKQMLKICNSLIVRSSK